MKVRTDLQEETLVGTLSVTVVPKSERASGGLG